MLHQPHPQLTISWLLVVVQAVAQLAAAAALVDLELVQHLQ